MCVNSSAALLQWLFAFLDVVPSSFCSQRDIQFHRLGHIDDSLLAVHICFRDPAKNIDQNRLNVCIRRSILNASVTCSSVAPPPAAEKISRASAINLMISIIFQPFSAMTRRAMFPSSPI